MCVCVSASGLASGSARVVSVERLNKPGRVTLRVSDREGETERKIHRKREGWKRKWRVEQGKKKR